MPSRVSEEKKANIRLLYAGGMSCGGIAKRCKMDDRTVRRIVADIPDPHAGRAQPLFAHLHAAKRCHHHNSALMPDDWDDNG